MIPKSAALVLVDIQNDFCPGGNLAVDHGDEVVAVANRLMPSFDVVVATQDWHPADHESFASQHAGRRPGEVIDLHGIEQVLWPDHCVQGSRGAELVSDLDRERIDEIVQKGTDRQLDSYSGFYDNDHRRATALGDLLRGRGIRDIYVMGLATDYCVKFTAVDGVREGFRVHLVEDGCRGVNLRPGDADAAVAEMRAAGVDIARSTDLFAGQQGASQSLE